MNKAAPLASKKLAEAARLTNRKNKTLGAFLQTTYEFAIDNDLECYSAQDIAKFSEATYKALSNRKGGTPLIEISEHVIGNKANPRTVTTLNIVNDNMPFLIDSVVPEIRALGYDIELLVHPIFVVERDKSGKLKSTPVARTPSTGPTEKQESLIHIHVGKLTASQHKELKSSLTSLLKSVKGVVRDWRPMLKRLDQAIEQYKTSPPALEVQKIAEAVQFLEWLRSDHFTFLGMREYRHDEKADRFIQPVEKSGLGILKDPKVHVLKRGNELVSITPEIREFITRPEPLIISKANVRSKIHRQVHMDYVGLKLYGEDGSVTGELRAIGLFTGPVYATSIADIPYIRHKAKAVMERAPFAEDSHSGKALWNVLEAYPRDELFQMGFQQLDEFAHAVLALDNRSTVRVLPRWDKFDRYVSVITFVPRDRYNTDVRIRIGEYLEDVFDGRVSAFYPGFPEGLLARVHFIIARNPGEQPAINADHLETAIEAITQTWEDSLIEALQVSRSKENASQYRQAFSAAYQEAFIPADSLNDIKVIEELQSSNDIHADFYRRPDMAANRIGLKLYNQLEPIELSTRVPLLENIGFRVINERTYKIEPWREASTYLHDMTLETTSGAELDLGERKELLTNMLLAIWNDKTGNDGYNALAINAGLAWRDVAVLRTVSRYLQQIGVTYSQDYMWRALNKNAEIAADLSALFSARFDPDAKGRDKKQSSISKQIDAALENVASLDEDQIIRRFRSVIMGTVRTNFFKKDANGETIPEISLKLAPREIEGLPEPRPYREIFMTSPRVEGLHLRYGKVARGGLRWSDRPEDFRTEVLGLVKAQQVKNAVIVPVGSKGGFVPKKLTPTMSRDEFIHEGTEAYKIFISNLLEITDNLNRTKVVHPENVVRHEEADPYLVVAADKGTATFSDTANGISQDHDFWLDDAFASGGSAGYDHKKMAITARGAWEAVKRHFREMDKDIQKEPFTAAGVGDMSGDVFGNGMLLSKATKLVAAFDHRDIFIDPDPDPSKTFKERKRLFDMGRSSWQDYNKKLISKGGGIFPRSLKSINISPEIQKMLGVTAKTMTPFELMRAILKMEVELFWFGGIGTYIRGPLETDADAGDRANDPIRIEAAEVGAKVIGEGANLGMTQRARIAYNKLGGRCNSDAIDNSAGVNSSDVEVNIKIALGDAVRAKKLTLPKRNALLESMTDEVADLVLRNNYQQSLAISLTQLAGMEDFNHQTRMMQDLEGRGLLDRAVEDLPNDVILEERRVDEIPLTRSEIGVLLAYAKINLFDDLIDSKVPDDPYLEKELTRYFPTAMQKKYAGEIAGHKLRREIIATQVCNAMINRGGATYLERVQTQTSATTPEIAKAYILVRDAFSFQALNARIDALDNKITGAVQLDLYHLLRRVLVGQTVWALRNGSFKKGIEAAIKPIADGIETLRPHLSKMLSSYMEADRLKRKQAYLDGGVPKDIAEDMSLLPALDLVPNIIMVADKAKKPLASGAKAYFALDEMFSLNRIDAMARDVETTDYYDNLALWRGRQQLARAHRAITHDVLIKHKGADPVASWYKANKSAIDVALHDLEEIIESDSMSVAKISVAGNIVSDLTKGA